MPTPEEPPIKPTIKDAAEEAARRLPKSVKNKEYQLRIVAEVSGEHNPIHGYKVFLTPR